ncbi:MAG TPA: hypothetical protein VFL97_04440 [Nitrococcus sp.]|nr:hypothetical protein [Nitrococcus sp.]
MNKIDFTLSLLLGIFNQVTIAYADQLPLDTAAHHIQPDPLVTPVRGATMDHVRQRFGMPVQILPAVGEPPITRWVYPQFIVYFERHWVIHSVDVAASAHRQNPAAK